MAEKLKEEQVRFLLGLTIPTREMPGIPAFFGMDTYAYQGPAGMSAFAQIYQAQVQTAQGETDEAFYRSLSQVAGVTLHLPTGQLWKTWQGYEAIQEGYLSGDDALKALIVGPPK